MQLTRICPGRFLRTVGSEKLSLPIRFEPGTENWSLWQLSCCRLEPMKEDITQVAQRDLLDQTLPEARAILLLLLSRKSTATTIIITLFG